ncbi:Lin1244/Lin1753 domain-containing protein [uncultured Empedobacter sp.]|mgnify:CR=1 FL=1|uniref:Lin1244/Lin1753 domain-containing protein n=1 Tax=uncultured Empedobacter sp. TaxID=410844 RepID=UPI00261A3D1A|nr:Lin1244/Lin1753 domain-containing protein [uncultured Empedobacter sp.]
MAKNKFYFSHDGGARNDDKMIAVRMKHKAEGYAVYFMILEKMLESSDYILLKDYNVLAFDFRVGSDLVKSIVEDFGLFEFTEDNKSFFSKSFLDRMKPLEVIREKRREAGKKSAEKRKIQQNSTSVEQVLNESSTSVHVLLTKNPTKESKVNNNTNVLLKKNPQKKDLGCVSENLNEEENSNSQTSKNLEEEKEKNCEKKEKELPEGFTTELRNSQFFKNVCEFFSQKSESLQMKVIGRMISIAREKDFNEFRKQTKAYMDYKNQTGEKVHRSQKFSFEWDQDDWIDKLKKINQTKTQNGNAKSESDDIIVGRVNVTKTESYLESRRRQREMESARTFETDI